MQKTNNVLLSCIILLAVLLGVVGGGIMGGLAGYYAAQAALPITTAAPALVVANAPAPAAVTQATTNLTLKEDSAVIDAVKQVKPAVVTVVNRMQPQTRRSFLGGGTITPTASGSGVIIDTKGYIVTNNHVIDQANALQVIFADGTKADAKLVGADPLADIAVIQVTGKMPATAPFGDSSVLQPGQTAIAIGSPMGDFRGTVTVGVVSALNRSVGTQQGLIQTDAAINNGNSGGPLINTLGQVIGINTLVVRSTNEGNVAEGLGFSIPSNQVQLIVSQLIAKGRVDRSYLGISYQPVDPLSASGLNSDVTYGVVVTQVSPGTPAAKAGIQDGDVVLAFDGQKLDQDALTALLLTHKAGEVVTLTIMRDGKQANVQVTLAARPTP